MKLKINGRKEDKTTVDDMAPGDIFLFQDRLYMMTAFSGGVRYSVALDTGTLSILGSDILRSPAREALNPQLTYE